MTPDRPSRFRGTEAGGPSGGAASGSPRKKQGKTYSGNRSRVESHKRIVPENHGERQKGQQFGGNYHEET
jgi:hypothetical protein